MGSTGIKGDAWIGEPQAPRSRLAAGPGAREHAEFERLGADLEARLDPIAAAVPARVREKHPDLELRGEARARVAQLARESLREQLRSFREGVLPERCPEVDAAGVAALAGEVGIGVLLDGYRLCQLTLWQAWFELVEDSPETSGAGRRALLARGSDFFFRYADLLCAYVATLHEREAGGRQAPSPELRRGEAVHELLEGERLAGGLLDFDLERHHVGAIAWGETAEAALRELAASVERPLMVVEAGGQPATSWGWISGRRALSVAEERTLARFAPSGARIALGLEGFDLAGFRASHRQALRAMSFAGARGPALIRYEDIVVEALACENEEDARAFVAHELRGIEDDSTTSRRLRETLLAYFESEYNAASAGARLGVHQQTVANRLRAAEERLGAVSIGLRRVELEMALRLRERLPANPV